MHKLLVTIGFTSLCVVTQAALAEPPRVLPPTSPSDLARKCEAANGTFGLTDTKYYCKNKYALVVCDLKTQECAGGTKDNTRGPKALPNAGLTRGFGAGGSTGDGAKAKATGTMNGYGTITKIPGASAVPSTGAIHSTTGLGQGSGSGVGVAVPPRSTISSTGDLLATTGAARGVGSLTGSTNGRPAR
jgi:hypothetical protein